MSKKREDLLEAAGLRLVAASVHVETLRAQWSRVMRLRDEATDREAVEMWALTRKAKAQPWAQHRLVKGMSGKLVTVGQFLTAVTRRLMLRHSLDVHDACAPLERRLAGELRVAVMQLDAAEQEMARLLAGKR